MNDLCALSRRRPSRWRSSESDALLRFIIVHKHVQIVVFISGNRGARTQPRASSSSPNVMCLCVDVPVYGSTPTAARATQHSSIHITHAHTQQRRPSRAKLLCTTPNHRTFVVAVHCCFDDTLHSYTLSRSLFVSLAPPASRRPHTHTHTQSRARESNTHGRTQSCTLSECVFGVLLLPFASIGFTPIASHELSCSCQIEVTRCEAKQLGACTDLN